MRPLRILVAGVLACTTAAIGALSLTSPAAGAGNDTPRAELAGVRAATAQFQDVDNAIDEGYELLDVCFESASGGMGIHYLKGIDATLDPLAPEALVYEVTAHGPKLVAVEYIVPVGLSASPPEVLGQQLHENSALGLWVLHAWIWEPNPDGMFADFNPNVAQCPEP